MLNKGDIRYIYILSCGHSGSTILDIALSVHPNIIGIGELYTFIKRLNRDKIDVSSHKCSCNKLWNKCEIWKKVFHECKIKYYFDYYDKILEISKKQYIVDSSKELQPLTHLYKVRDKVLIIHLIRNPCGSIYRYYVKYNKLFRFIIFWIWYNIKIRIWIRNFPNKILLRYEDFVSEPLHYLKKICSMINEEYQEKYLSNLNVKSHQIEGNRIRLKEVNKIEPKDEWKEKMRKSHKIIIYLLTLPLYIYFYRRFPF